MLVVCPLDFFFDTCIIIFHFLIPFHSVLMQNILTSWKTVVAKIEMLKEGCCKLLTAEISKFLMNPSE